MATYTQARRPLIVTTPLPTDDLLLVGFTGHEAISQLFHFQLDLLAENGVDIPFAELLGKNITVALEVADDEYRYFNGLCNRLSQGGQDELFTSYRMQVVPQFWLLTRRAQSRIFQHMTVPEILRKVLEGFDVNYELYGTFPPRDYCVQYRETDFNFASRLMEEEGIYYFFKHADGRHTLVLANTPQSHPELPGDCTLLYEVPADGQASPDRVLEWEKLQELRSGKYTLWDHCFELPHKHLEAERGILSEVDVGEVTHPLRVGGNDRLEIYDYPGDYAQRFDGVNKGGGEQPAELQKIFQDNQRTVTIRIQEEAAAGLVIHAASTYRHLVSGYKFDLERHFNANGPYVLTGVQHTAKLSNFRSGGGEFRYANTFTCIPMGLPFRPARVTPKPFVQGTQTAVVVGPPGEEVFTDKYGRVKVQFHWDRQGQRNADSSCWVRVAQPWAGKRWGAFFWPRVGHEVIVAFQEGDPDQPIIVGSVYNAEQMPPYLGQGPDPKHPNDNKLTGVKSNSTTGGAGFNEWRFDDTKGKEQIFIHAERNLDVRVKHDALERVLHDHNLIVGADKDGKKSGDLKEMVYQDKHLHVHRDQIEQIEGNLRLTVGKGQAQDGGRVDLVIEKKKTELIGAEGHDLTIQGGRKESVGGSAALTVGGEQQVQVKGTHTLEAKMIQLKADSITLEAGQELTIIGGGSVIVLSAAGISIDGTMVKINCGGVAGGAVIAPVPAPADAQQAQPAAPAAADDAKTGSKSAPG